MIYRVLADAVIVFHLVFILFGLLGGLFILWRKWILLFHLPSVVWIVLIEFKGWICPLTPLENYFHELAGQVGYTGGFIEHYLIPIIYPAGLTSDIQFVLGCIAFGINILVYLFVIQRVIWKP